MKTLNSIDELGFEYNPVRKLQLFTRIPKSKLVLLLCHKGTDYVPIVHPETKDENLFWLAVDLLILTFGNALDYALIENPEVVIHSLRFWKKDIASRPQMGFCEITRPDKITDEIALYACTEILKSKFFKETFYPALEKEMYIAHHSADFYRNLPASPIEKSTTRMFLTNYLKDSVNN